MYKDLAYLNKLIDDFEKKSHEYFGVKLMRDGLIKLRDELEKQDDKKT